MCLYPRLIKNPKYKKNKKNGGVIPAFLDERVLAVPIGCGECIECRKQKRRNWQVRLLEEGEKATIHIICLDDTIDVEWCKKGLSNLNQSKITWKKENLKQRIGYLNN